MRNSEPGDLLIKFERIGRTGATPEAALTLHVPTHLAVDADQVAEVVYLHCKRHLMSRDFEVTVNLEDDTVFLEYGRFGRGRIHRVTDTHPKCPCPPICGDCDAPIGSNQKAGCEGCAGHVVECGEEG